MDVELIATIEGTVYEIWRTKERIRALNANGDPVPEHLKGYLRRLDRNLNKMRSVAVYYREYSSIENLWLHGENYIKQMKRDLTPLTFQTSILCRRIGIAKDGFYSSMREAHKYDANDNQYLDTLGFDYDFSTLIGAPHRRLRCVFSRAVEATSWSIPSISAAKSYHIATPSRSTLAVLSDMTSGFT